MTRSARRQPADSLALAVATVGGAGFVPAMPGTAGALVAVAFYVLATVLGLFWLYLWSLPVLTLLGVWAAGRVEPILGHDASEIVIDEVIGQMMALGFVVPATSSVLVSNAILGFLLFRFFDILKPFPIRSLERFPGGIGVVADDVGAGIYALLVLLLAEPVALELF